MRNNPNPFPSMPPNAFTPSFLRRMEERDEPETAPEADTAGPWRVVSTAGGGFAVLRQGEFLELGDRPAAIFRERAMALLAAAVLPSTGRAETYRLTSEGEREGFALLLSGQPAGYLRLFDESLAAALHVADNLARSPGSLAILLEAAGGLALERAGRILEDQTGS